MSIPPAPPVAAPTHRAPSARAVRIRRTISMILSCLTIAGASVVLYLGVFDKHFFSFDGTFQMNPFEAFMWGSIGYWIVPGVASLILLSNLPRPATLSARLPKIFGLIATVLSAMCIAIPMLFAFTFIGSFLLAAVSMVFR